jgi:PAS domain S-box-containing protein
MKQLVAILAATADGAFIVDQHGKVRSWNRAAERLLGFRADEVLGRPCHEVIRGESLCGQPVCSVHCPIGNRLAGGRAVRNFDMQTHTKDGRTIWLNMSSLPIPSPKQPGMAAHLFRDITRQAKMRKLVEELHSAVAGQMPLENMNPATKSPPPIQSGLPLSDREREVLLWLAKGEDTKQIADRLCISPATVRNHTQHILEKLGAHSRLQALVIAFHPTALRSAPPSDEAQG